MRKEVSFHKPGSFLSLGRNFYRYERAVRVCFALSKDWARTLRAGSILVLSRRLIQNKSLSACKLKVVFDTSTTSPAKVVMRGGSIINCSRPSSCGDEYEQLAHAMQDELNGDGGGIKRISAARKTSYET